MIIGNSGFEYFDHTADIGLKATGRDLAEAFTNAAKGMFGIITSISKVRPVLGFELELEAAEIDTLLQKWLSELLFLHEINHVLFSEFEVTITKSEQSNSGSDDDQIHYKIHARALGEAYDPNRHNYRTEIKAVTRHLLEVDELNRTLVVLFDI